MLSIKSTDFFNEDNLLIDELVFGLNSSSIITFITR